MKKIVDENQTENHLKDTLKWSDFTTRRARKALLISIVLIIVCVWNGAYAMTTYLANVFQETGSNFTPNVSAIIVGVVQSIGTLAALQLIDRSGRKVDILSSN